MPHTNYSLIIRSMDEPVTSFDPKANIILVTGSLLEQDKRQALHVLMSSQMRINISQEKKYVLVDVPSFDATSNEGGREESLQKIATFLVQLHTSSIPVKGILHIHDITVKKTSSLIETDLDMLQAIAGEHFYPGIIFATAFWSEDAVTRGIEEKRESELIEILWKNFVNGGAQVFKIFTDNEPIAPDLVEICNVQGEVVQLVKELVHLELPLRSTTAGVTLSSRLSPQYPTV